MELYISEMSGIPFCFLFAKITTEYLLESSFTPQAKV